MPGTKFTKKIKSNKSKKGRQWQHIYDSAISRGESKATAIKEASGVIKKETSHKKK